MCPNVKLSVVVVVLWFGLHALDNLLLHHSFRSEISNARLLQIGASFSLADLADTNFLCSAVSARKRNGKIFTPLRLVVKDDLLVMRRTLDAWKESVKNGIFNWEWFQKIIVVQSSRIWFRKFDEKVRQPVTLKSNTFISIKKSSIYYFYFWRNCDTALWVV